MNEPMNPWVALLIVVGLVALARELVTWWFKLNAIVALLTSMDKRLAAIEQKFAGSASTPTPAAKPKPLTSM